MTEMHDNPLLQIKGLQDLFPHRSRNGEGRGRRQFRHHAGRSRGSGRRIRIGKERDGAEHSASDSRSSGKDRRRLDTLQGTGPAEDVLGRDPENPRQRDQHDLPGADDVAESRVHDRHADHGSRAASREDFQKGSIRSVGGDAEAGRHSGSGLAHERLSASVSPAACGSA